jgi:hypothetical protein
MYVMACKFKHAIAFIQWRLYFSENRKASQSDTQMEDAEVEQVIDQRIDILKDRAQKLYKDYYLHTDTAEISFMPIKNSVSYGFKTETKHWLINSFHQVGWPDPFP